MRYEMSSYKARMSGKVEVLPPASPYFQSKHLRHTSSLNLTVSSYILRSNSTTLRSLGKTSTIILCMMSLLDISDKQTFDLVPYPINFSTYDSLESNITFSKSWYEEYLDCLSSIWARCVFLSMLINVYSIGFH